MKYWEICRKSRRNGNLNEDTGLILALHNTGGQIFASCDLIGGLERDLDFWNYPTQWLFKKGSIEYGYRQGWSAPNEYVNLRRISETSNKAIKVAVVSAFVNPNFLNCKDVFSGWWSSTFELRVNITYLFFGFGNTVIVRGTCK